MASEIDWGLDPDTLRKQLLILSTNKLKMLCKTRNVVYSKDKSETVASLINSNDANNNQTTHIRSRSQGAPITHNAPTPIQGDFEEKKPKEVIKVGMLGDSQVGIRSLMVKYIEDKYDELRCIEIFGVNFMEKTIHLKFKTNVDVTISIWPIRGRSWNSWISLVGLDAKVIIFAFDLTHKMTLYSVKRWYKKARKENKYFMPILVGTKYDLYKENNKEFNIDITQQARKYASKMHSPLVYCSSLEGINVKKIFKLIVAKVFELRHPMQQVHMIDDAIFEWTKNGRTMEEKICIVYGYIRQIKNEYKWKYEMPNEDFSNIVLLFYANIVIGGNNKEYKMESKTHKKMERKKRIRKEKSKRKKTKKKKKQKNDKLLDDQYYIGHPEVT